MATLPQDLGYDLYRIDALHEALRNESLPTLANAERIMKHLSPEDRLEVMSNYCHGCGGDRPCYCQNDE